MARQTKGAKKSPRSTEERAYQSNLKNTAIQSSVSSGVYVTEQNALTVSAVFACVRVIAETTATLPLHVYRRLPTGGKQREASHPVYRLLHDEPNPECTAVGFRESLLATCLLWGNAYAEIERDRSGRPLALWLIPSKVVTPVRITADGSNTLAYSVKLDGGKSITIFAQDMIHVAGLGFDGIMGLSPIALAREAIGLGMAVEKYGASFFGNSASPKGVLRYPGKLSADAINNLRDSWEDLHRGVTNVGRTAILEQGSDWVSLGIGNDDAQFLETRNFQIPEICRFFRVPPHMIHDLSKATFSNIEHQSIDFTVHTLRPWLVRLEQEFNRKLLNKAEREFLFCEHLVDRLLRGDTPTRTSALHIQFMDGALTDDEWREIENRNPQPNGTGQTFYVPANLIPVEKLLAPPPEPQPEPPPSDPEPTAYVPDEPTTDAEDEPRSSHDALETRHQNALEACRAVVADSLGRMIRRECQALRRASRKPHDFLSFLDTFYTEHADMMSTALMPSVRAYLAVADSETDAEHFSNTLAQQVAEHSREQLLELSGNVTADELSESVEQVACYWEQNKSGDILDILLASS